MKDFKEFTVNVNGTQSIEKAFVTGGGVSVKEINPKEMSSKFTNGLYFCGEVLDIHGYTGGYNITSALVTGRIAERQLEKTRKCNIKLRNRDSCFYRYMKLYRRFCKYISDSTTYIGDFSNISAILLLISAIFQIYRLTDKNDKYLPLTFHCFLLLYLP